MLNKVRLSILVLLACSAGVHAAEIGIGLPGTAIYYHDVTASDMEYRVGATLGTPTTLFASYRGQIKQVKHLFWEGGLSFGSAGGADIPLSLGYRLQIEKRFAIEPLLTLSPLNASTGFGVNIAYKL